MTIIETGDVRFLPFGGFDEPGLPIANWECSVIATGDSSGGALIAQINIAAANVQPGDFFSLEEITAVHSEAGAAGDASLDAFGFKSALPGSIDLAFRLPLSVVSGSSDLYATLTRPRLFLDRKRLAGQTAALSCAVTNSINETLEIFCRGYMWGPRSVNTAGGLRRPSSGLFPN